MLKQIVASLMAEGLVTIHRVAQDGMRVRARMGTAAAKTIYRLRSQTAEWINALCRNRGFLRMLLRGRVN